MKKPPTITCKRSQTLSHMNLFSPTKLEKKFVKNRIKLWIFNFFVYLCEKIKN